MNEPYSLQDNIPFAFYEIDHFLSQLSTDAVQVYAALRHLIDTLGKSLRSEDLFRISGLSSSSDTKEALTELQDKGFIEKAYNAPYYRTEFIVKVPVELIKDNNSYLTLVEAMVLAESTGDVDLDTIFDQIEMYAPVHPLIRKNKEDFFNKVCLQMKANGTLDKRDGLVYPSTPLNTPMYYSKLASLLVSNNHKNLFNKIYPVQAPQQCFPLSTHQQSHTTTPTSGEGLAILGDQGVPQETSPRVEEPDSVSSLETPPALGDIVLNTIWEHIQKKGTIFEVDTKNNRIVIKY
jgi:hypothetical protein